MALVTLEPFIPDIGRFWSNDDPAIWTGNPLHSWIIPELTQQTPVTPLQVRFTGYDDPAFWQATVYPNLIAVQPVPKPVTPLLARFNIYDEASPWLAAPIRSQTLPMLIVGGQPPTRDYSPFTLDDPSVWSGQPLASWIIPELTQGGKPPFKDWSFIAYDEAAFWDARPLRSQEIFILTSGGSPFSNRYQPAAVQGNYDIGETVWQFQTPYALNVLTIKVNPFFSQANNLRQGASLAYDVGNDSFWTWQPPRAWAGLMPAPVVPVGLPSHPTPYSATVNFGKMGSS
jgi:hypothetical protein